MDRRARPRRLRPPDHREHAAGVHDCPASTTSRRGTRRSARAPGAASPRAPARSCAARSTSSTGRRSSARSRRWSSCCTSSPRRRGTRRRPRSRCIGGDVHTAYVAEVAPRRAAGEPRLPDRLLAVPEPAAAAGAARRSSCSARAPPASSRALLARAGGRPAAGRDAGARLRPTFDNSIAVLELDERARTAHDPAQRARGRRRPGRSSSCYTRDSHGAPER